MQDTANMHRTGLEITLQLLSKWSIQSLKFSPSVFSEFLLLALTSAVSLTIQMLNYAQDGLNLELFILSLETTMLLVRQSKNFTFSLNMKLELRRVFLKDIHYFDLCTQLYLNSRIKELQLFEI